jgi:DNA-binding GntR family transcriptional regulator
VSGDVGEAGSPTLPARLAAHIIEYAKLHEMPVGSHLREQALADAFRVSRTPVRVALRHLEEMDIVECKPNRGFFLKQTSARLASGSPVAAPPEDDDPLYFEIAEDRVAGRLDIRFTETELMRRYSVTRSRLMRLLARMTREGWLDRLPGRGWEFQPVLTSLAAYAQSYRFRLLIEPAALMEPGYAVGEAAFTRARAQQQAMLAGGILIYSRAETFQIGAQFHETIVAASGNAFLLDALRRVNRVRRLIEYRAHKERTRLVQECKDHVHLLDLLEARRQDEAVAFLRVHLDRARVSKMPLSREPGDPPGQARADGKP